MPASAALELSRENQQGCPRAWKILGQVYKDDYDYYPMIWHKLKNGRREKLSNLIFNFFFNRKSQESYVSIFSILVYNHALMGLGKD